MSSFYDRSAPEELLSAPRLGPDMVIWASIANASNGFAESWRVEAWCRPLRNSEWASADS